MAKGFPYAGAAAKGTQESLSEDDLEFLEFIGAPGGEPSAVPVEPYKESEATSDFNFLEFVHTYTNDLPFVPAITDPNPPSFSALAESYTADGMPLFRQGDMSPMNEQRWADIATAGSIDEKLAALSGSERFAAGPELEFAMARSLALQFVKEHDISRGISAFGGRPDVEGDIGGTSTVERLGARKIPPVSAFEIGAGLPGAPAEVEDPGPQPDDLLGRARAAGLSEDSVAKIRVALAHELDASARPVFGDPTRYESHVARNASNLLMISLAKFGIGAGFVASVGGDLANLIQGTPPAPLGEPQDLTYRLDKSVHVDYPVAKAMHYNMDKGQNILGLLDKANIIAMRHDVSPVDVLEQMMNPMTNQEGFRAFLGLQDRPGGGFGAAPFVSTPGVHTPDLSPDAPFVPLDPEWALSARMSTPRREIDAVSREVRLETDRSIRDLVARGAFGEDKTSEDWQNGIAALFAISQANTVLESFGGRSLTEEYLKNLGHGFTVGTVEAMAESLGFLSTDEKRREASFKKMKEDYVLWAFDVALATYIGANLYKGAYVRGARFADDPAGIGKLFDDLDIDIRTPGEKGISSQRAAEARARNAARDAESMRAAAVESAEILSQEFVDRPPGITRVSGVRDPSRSLDRTMSEVLRDQSRAGSQEPVILGGSAGDAASRTVADWANVGRTRGENRARSQSRAIDEGRVVTTNDGVPVQADAISALDAVPTPAVRRSAVSRDLARSVKDPEMKGLLEEHARLIDEREAALLLQEARLDVLNPERADLASQAARFNSAGMTAGDMNRILAIQKRVGRSLDDIPTQELKAIAEQRGINTGPAGRRADLIEALDLYRLMPLENWRSGWLSTELHRLGSKKSGNKLEKIRRLREVYDKRGGLSQADLARIEAGAIEFANMPQIHRAGVDDIVDVMRKRVSEVAADPKIGRQVSAALDVLEISEGIVAPNPMTPLPQGITSFTQLSSPQRARILSAYRSATSPSQRGVALAERGVMDPAIYAEIGLHAGEVAVNTLRAREVYAAKSAGGVPGDAPVMPPAQRLLAHEEKMALRENMTLDQWRINRSLEERAASLSKSGIDSIPMYEELGIPYNMASKYADSASAIQRPLSVPKSPERVFEAFGPLDIPETLIRAFDRTPDVLGTGTEVAAGVLSRVLVGRRATDIVAGRRPPSPGMGLIESTPGKVGWMVAEMMERPFAILNIPAAISDAFGTLIARQGAGVKTISGSLESLLEAFTTGSAKYGELYYMLERFRRTQNFHGDIIAPLLRDLSGSGKKKVTASAEDARNVFEEVFKAEEAEAYANQFASDGDVVFRVREANRFADVALRMEDWSFKTGDGANTVRFGELFEKQGRYGGRWVPIDTLNSIANARKVSPERVWGGVVGLRWKPLKDLADMPAEARTAFYVANRYARPINEVIFEQSLQMAMHPETAFLSVADDAGVVGTRKLDIYRKDALKNSVNYLSDYYDARQVYITTVDLLKSMSEGKSMAEVQMAIESIDKLMGKVMPAKVVNKADTSWKNQRMVARKEMDKANASVDRLNESIRQLESEVAEIVGGKSATPKEIDGLSGRIKSETKLRDEALSDAVAKTDAFRELDGTKSWKMSELVEMYKNDKSMLDSLPESEIPANIERFYRSRVWKDLPYAEKLQMGLFDFREAAANTVLGQGHNLAFQKYMTWMRENGMIITKQEYGALSDDVARQYVPPGMKDNPVYGNLGEDFMIHRMSKLQLQRLNDSFVAARSAFGKWSSAWKLGMVSAVDTVMRNIWTNIFTLGLIAEIPASLSQLNRAHAELVEFQRTGKESDLLREYRSLGGGKSSVSQTEFLDPDIWVDYQFKVANEYRSLKQSGALDGHGDQFQKAVENMLLHIPRKGQVQMHAEFIEQINMHSMKNPISIEDAVGPPTLSSRASGVAKSLRDSVARKYSYVDDLQKYAYFLQLVDEHGIVPREAMRRADDVYMDYADIAPVLQAIRNPGTGIRTLGSSGPQRMGDAAAKAAGKFPLGLFSVGTSVAAPFVAFGAKALAKQFDLATHHPMQSFVLSHLMDAYNLACAQTVDMDVEELMAQMRLDSAMPLPVVSVSENPRAMSPSEMVKVGPGKIPLLGLGLTGTVASDLQRESMRGIEPGIGNVFSAILGALTGRGDVLYQVGEAFGDKGGQFERFDPSNPWGESANNIWDHSAAALRSIIPREVQRWAMDVPATFRRERVAGRDWRPPMEHVTGLAGARANVADQADAVKWQGRALRGKVAMVEKVVDSVIAQEKRGELNDESLLSEAISLYENVLVPWHYGIDGGLPLKDMQKQAEADSLNKMMDQYVPAFIALMRDRGMPMDKGDLKALEDLMIQQGLSETEAMMTIGDRMYQPPASAMPAEGSLDILNYENE